MPIFKNTDLKNSMMPTLLQMKAYVAAATIADSKLRDVRALMSFLQQLAKVDRYLLGLIQTRKYAVMGFPYTIKFPDGVKVGPTEGKQLAEIKRRFVKSKMESTFNTLMNGRIAGMSACRLVWENVTGMGTMVTKKKNLQLTELDYDLENDDNLKVLTTDANGGFTTADIDKDIHMFLRFNPLAGIDDDFPGGLLRTNMICIWLKYTDYFNWASSNEKFGDPLTVALYDKNRVEKKDLDAIDQGLRDLGTASRARFSNDIELKFLEAARTGMTDMHDRFIQAVNIETAISTLGQNLTTEVTKGGSFAATRAHNYVREDYLWADIIDFQNCQSTQYVMKDYDKNYGEPKEAYPEFIFKTDEEKNFESNARTFEALKAAKPDLPFKKEEVYQKCGFTVPAEGDETI